MRKGGVIFVLVTAVLLFGLSYVSIDAWLESRIEYQASVANKAKVEIDDLDLSLVGLSMSWDRLEVANPEDPWENIFETGKVEFNMEFWPLLWNKTVIENMQLSGFRLNTERDTDGSFEVEKEISEGSAGEAFLASVVEQVSTEASRNARAKVTDVRSDLNTDSLLAELDLKAPEKIDSLRSQIAQQYGVWDSTLNNLNVEQQIQRIRETTENIKIDEIKDPKKVVEAINNVKKLRSQADSLRNLADSLRNGFTEDLNSARYSVGKVDEWVTEDYRRAMSLAKIPDLSAQNIGKLLFGQNLLGDYAAYLSYIETARKYSARLTDDGQEKRERYEGVNYEFSDKYDWPELWIRKIEVSGSTNNGIDIQGLVNDISSDQRRSGSPTRIDIRGEGRSGDRLKLEGQLDYTGQEPRESFELMYNGFSLKDTRISPSELLPYQLNNGTGSVRAELDIVSRRIDSEVSYVAENISFDMGSSDGKSRIQQLIRSAISNTDRIDVTGLIDNIDGPLRVRLRSNLDDLFVNALRETVSKEISQAREKIEAEVESRVEDKKEELLAFKQQKEEELRERATEIRSRIDEQLQVVEEKQKALEKKKKELEDSLKNKIKDKIGIDF